MVGEPSTNENINVCVMVLQPFVSPWCHLQYLHNGLVQIIDTKIFKITENWRVGAHHMLLKTSTPMAEFSVSSSPDTYLQTQG